MDTVYGLFLVCFLVLSHEFGHYLAAKLFNVHVLIFSFGFGPKLFTYSHKNTEYSIGAIPIGGYVEFLENPLENPITDNAFKNKNFSFSELCFWKKLFIVLAGPLANIIVSVFILLCININLDLQKGSIQKIGYVANGSIAFAIGLKSGDQIVSLEKRRYIEPSSIEILDILEDKDPKKIKKIKIKRSENLKDFNSIPIEESFLRLIRNAVLSGNIGLVPQIFPEFSIFNFNFLTIFKQTLLEVYELAISTVSSILELFYLGNFIGQISGPLIMIDDASRLIFYGAKNYFINMAFLGINLAMLNLLPLPTFDGGRVILIIIETFFQKSLQKILLKSVKIIGVGIFIFLIITATINDIKRILN